MRYLIIISFAFVLIASSFWGCQKEDLGNLDGIFSDTAQTGPVSQMNARINGVPWAATSYSITLTPGTPGQILITGESDNGQTITLVVASTKPGDYLISKLSPSVAYFAPDTNSTLVYKSNDTATTGGVINIDSIDTANLVMSGEFNFIGGAAGAKTRATITDGNFVNLGFVNTSANTQFAAKVNQKSWIPQKVTTSLSATNVLTITAVNANGTKMLLSFPAGIKAAKTAYPLASTGTYTALYEDNGTNLVPDVLSTYNTAPKIACSIKITSNTTTGSPKNIKGTFLFYAVPTNALTSKGSRITSGQFNVNY